MDTGKGNFEQFGTIEEAMQKAERLGRAAEVRGVFQKGETLSLRGSTFRVDRITKTHLILRLQRRQDGGRRDERTEG